MDGSETLSGNVKDSNVQVSDDLLRIQRDIGIALCSSSNLLTSLERLLETTLNIGVIDCGGIYFLDEDTDELYLVMQKNLSQKFISKNSHYSSNSTQRKILEKGLPFYGKCFDFTDNISDDLFTSSLRGCGIIPIIYKTKVVGSLNVASHNHYELPSEVCDSLEAISAQVGGFMSRIRSELNLEKRQMDLQNLFDSIEDLFFVIDLKGRIVDANKRTFEMLGYSLEELRFLGLLGLHSEKDRGKAMNAIIDVREKDHASFSIPFLTKGGSSIPVEVKVTPGKWNGKDVYFGICRDISDREHAEVALKSSEEKYRVVFNASLDGITIHEKENYRLLDINDRGCEISGYSREEVLGRTAEDIKQGKALFSLDKIKWLIDTASENGYATAEWEARKKNGEMFWTEVMAKATMIGGKERVIITIHDLTERKNAEKALMEIESMRKKEIHHRIKNNLQIICSLLDLCSMEFDDTPVVQAFMDSKNRVMSMSLIHEELYRSTDMESINFADYIRKLSAELINSYSIGKDIDLDLNVEDIFLSMDIAIPLGIIINELVTNSLKHAFQGSSGKISIDLKRGDENKFILIVSDNGIGFPEGLDHRKSTSLGLQLLNTLVDQIGGTIAMERSHGTSFTIIFDEKDSI